MRKSLLMAVLALPTLALAQVTPKTSETKVESTTTTPSTTDTAKTDKTVKQKSDGSTSSTVEKTAKHDAPGTKNDKKTHTKSTTEKSPSGSVTKSETTEDKK